MLFVRIVHVILFFLLPINFAWAQQDKDGHPSRGDDVALGVTSNSIMCISIPKCGTHLFTKCLALLDPKNITIAFDYNQDKQYKETLLNERMRRAIETNKKLAPKHDLGGLIERSTLIGTRPEAIVYCMKNYNNHAYSEHWPYSQQSEQFFDQHTRANFFIIRDPRDMIVSMAFYVSQGPDNLKINIDDLIFDFIDGRKQHFAPWGVGTNPGYPLLYEHGVAGFYNLYLPWMNVPKFYTVKFENLVGSKGGGSDDAQLLEIKNIANHLGITVDDNQIKNITDNLFGASTTFREGQIGSWKKHFTSEMKTAFKKAPGACDLLIALGYEKDSNW